MTVDDLAEMPPKFRQHLFRKHETLASSTEGKKMISHGKALICPLLHPPLTPQVLRVIVSLFVFPCNHPVEVSSIHTVLSCVLYV